MEDNFIDLGEMTDSELNAIYHKPPKDSETQENASAEGNEEPKEPETPKEPSDTNNPEIVGNGEDNNGEESTPDKGGSPNQITSIANAFEGSAFQTLNKERLNQIKTAEDFDAAMNEEVENRINSRFDERQKRIEEALNYKVPQTTIQQYENSLAWLDKINDSVLEDETKDESENIRKQLIYTGYILDGLSKERAQKLTQQSFESGTDIDDAKEALPMIKQKYQAGYDNVIKEAKANEQAKIDAKVKLNNDIENAIMKDDTLFKQLGITDVTRKKIYENISQVAYTDDDGRQYTALQKYMKDNPVDSNKIIGMLWTVTDGFKNFDNLFTEKANKVVKKKIDKLEQAFNTLSGSYDGGLHLTDNDATPPKKFDVTQDFDIVFDN